MTWSGWPVAISTVWSEGRPVPGNLAWMTPGCGSRWTSPRFPSTGRGGQYTLQLTAHWRPVRHRPGLLARRQMPPGGAGRPGRRTGRRCPRVPPLRLAWEQLRFPPSWPAGRLGPSRPSLHDAGALLGAGGGHHPRPELLRGTPTGISDPRCSCSAGPSPWRPAGRPPWSVRVGSPPGS